MFIHKEWCILSKFIYPGSHVTGFNVTNQTQQIHMKLQLYYLIHCICKIKELPVPLAGV